MWQMDSAVDLHKLAFSRATTFLSGSLIVVHSPLSLTGITAVPPPRTKGMIF